MKHRIAITGPESTGKSCLAAGLAEHFKTLWVPEYAREYLNKIKRPYTKDDILQIAKSQYDIENQMFNIVSDFLFCDTEFLVTKIWSKSCYGSCHEWIEEKFITHKYDLYLLCDVDLPWEPDPLREHPGEGEYYFNWFCKELSDNALPFVVINGKGKKRLENAVKSVYDRFPGCL